ncbi:hypothetical protein ACI796_01350 [Geodermatophilus sp. SYSU D00525]
MASLSRDPGAAPADGDRPPPRQRRDRTLPDDATGAGPRHRDAEAGLRRLTESSKR